MAAQHPNQTGAPHSQEVRHLVPLSRRGRHRVLARRLLVRPLPGTARLVGQVLRVSTAAAPPERPLATTRTIGVAAEAPRLLALTADLAVVGGAAAIVRQAPTRNAEVPTSSFTKLLESHFLRHVHLHELYIGAHAGTRGAAGAGATQEGGGVRATPPKHSPTHVASGKILLGVYSGADRKTSPARRFHFRLRPSNFSAEAVDLWTRLRGCAWRLLKRARGQTPLYICMKLPHRILESHLLNPILIFPRIDVNDTPKRGV